VGKTYRPYEPNQILLLPPVLNEWLPAEHLANFVNDLVDQLNLSEIYAVYEKEERGYPPYHPLMLTKLLVYGYCIGVTSSRKIEQRCQEDVGFRLLAANNRPDFRTISDFRKRHLKALEGFFLQILEICQEAGLVKMGHVAIDGTKVKANASKHKAMSYERMKKKEKFLAAQVKALFKEAERIDEEEDKKYGKDQRGDELPEELRFRETRIKKIRDAMKALQAEAKQKQAAGSSKSAAVNPKAQKNFTDPQSRIMLDGATKGFVQAYNAQVAVDGNSQVIVACDVVQEANDKQQALPLMKQVKANTGQCPLEASLDAGYFSEENVTELEAQGIEAFCPPNRLKRDSIVPCVVSKNSEAMTVKDRMREKLNTPIGTWIYGKRKEIVEPVIGQIKHERGFRQFLTRGLTKVRGEWSLMCTTHNILKLYRNWTKALKEQKEMAGSFGLAMVRG
jgi:transposase